MPQLLDDCLDDEEVAPLMSVVLHIPANDWPLLMAEMAGRIAADEARAAEEEDCYEKEEIFVIWEINVQIGSKAFPFTNHPGERISQKNTK
jgi:hypothetical protein